MHAQSHKDSFNSSAQIYDQALSHSKYESKLHYLEDSHPKRNRRRNTIWFNPPYKKNVRTSVGKEFLRLINKHFPQSSNLHKIFNKNNLKVSYSCINNVKRVNCGHNRRVLSNPPSIHHYLLRENASAKMKTSAHSLIGKKCMKKDIVYKAEISAKDNGQMKE